MLFSVFGSLPIVITSSLFSQCASPTDGAFTNRRMTSLSFILSLSFSLFLAPSLSSSLSRETPHHSKGSLA